MDYLLSSTHRRNESLSNTVSLMSTSYPFPFNPQGSHSGLIKILNEKGDLFLTYFMTYFFICTLLENCTLGFDTLYVTDAEMFPDSRMTKTFQPLGCQIPRSLWSFATHSAGLAHTRQTSGTVSV